MLPSLVMARLRIAAVVSLTLTLLAAATPALAQGSAVAGFARDPDGKPLQGVRYTVLKGDRTIGTALTDAQGRWEVKLPSGGTYAVEIDRSTIPRSLELRTGVAKLPSVQVQDGQTRFVIFPLVPKGQGGKAAAAGGPSAVDKLARLALQGVRLGLIIAMAAVGLSLIFGVTGLVNFAHGELVTFGALVAWWLASWGSGPNLPLILAAVIAVVAGAALGLGLERGLFRPLRRRRTGNISLIVVTIGLSLALQNLFLILFGGQPRPYDEYTIQRQVGPGPLTLPPKDWAIVALSALILVGIGLLLQRTRLGTALRAVADNADLAASSGIAVPTVIALTWIAAGALAATGGIFLGISESVSFNMGLDMLLLMFAAVVLGGIGTAYGAAVGALAIGVVTQVATYWVQPQVKNAVAFAVLIGVLLIRPQGILGRKERIG
jgi:branched-chain amino acid transport system permease protein